MEAERCELLRVLDCAAVLREGAGKHRAACVVM